MSAPADLSEDAVRAVLGTYASGWLSAGPRVAEFEAALAAACGVPHAVAVASTTAARHLALRAVGVVPGCEVAVSPSAPAAVTAAIELCGARASVVDDESLPTLPSGSVTALVAGRPHGVPHDLGALRAWCDARGLPLVEDALIGSGPPVGDVAVVSLSAPSPVDVGVGGAVLTASDAHRAAVASWRSHAMTSGTWERHHGRAASYDVVDVGYNYRLDEPRAALGLARLGELAG